MDTLESLQNQLKTTEGQMAGYSADLPSEIETQLQKAYSPILKESLGVTKNLMGDYLSRYYDTTQMGPGMAGTTAKDLSPTQKLGVMGRELGTMAGDLQATQKYSDYLGGQMNDAYSKALQAAQLGQQNLSDQYGRLFQQYQMAWQQAESEKDRALQRELSKSSGSGGFSLGDIFGDVPTDNTGANTTKLTQQQQAILSVQNMANKIAQLRKTGNTFVLNGQKIGGIDAVHDYINNLAAKNYGVKLNPEWLWQQLGNTPASPQTQSAVLY